MNDRFRIDTHKLHFHPGRVADWLAGGMIAPLYMEISPTGACNLRCVFCATDYIRYVPRRLDAGLLGVRLSEMGRMGLKSVMFAGEGEPFLHPDMADIAEAAHQAGVDCAFTTNGTLLDPDTAKRILPITTWIKVSCNAGTPESYARIHGAKGEYFAQVIGNLEEMARLRRDSGWTCTLGMQALLLPENRGEMPELARICRDIGLDYFVVKPYSHNPQSHTERFRNIDYADAGELTQELGAYETASFSPIVRLHAMDKWQDGRKPYGGCLGLPFFSYLDAGGNIWGCSVFMNQQDFWYGNINNTSFYDIWHGETRKKSLKFVECEMDISYCRINCRLDEINRYLWELRHPGAHVNFI